MAVFEGAGVALITPFKENGEVNYDKLEEIVEEQIAGGTDAIIACGTTGEASTMTHEEHLDVIGFICDVTKKRIPVVAGTGSNCTQTAIYLSKEAEERGADGILVVSPYYYLRQNDIIYVTPNKTKAKNSDIGSSTSIWISATSILVSLASLLATILK